MVPSPVFTNELSAFRFGSRTTSERKKLKNPTRLYWRFCTESATENVSGKKRENRDHDLTEWPTIFVILPHDEQLWPPSVVAALEQFRNFSDFKKDSVALNTEPSSPKLNATLASAAPYVPFTAKPFTPSEYLQNELRRWDPTTPITHAPTPPSTWYVDPLFLKAEAKSVFSKNWIQVGRTDQLKEKGDYISGNILGEPYIVVRDNENQLRAFFNVCRHHASRIVQAGQGALPDCQLVCPYHGWTYTLEGSLKKATQIKGIKDFKASEYGLKPMLVQTFGPWIFIKTDNKSGWDLSEELKPLSEVLERTRFSDLKWVASSNYTVNCNWKVYVDNYCDGGYHVPYLHKGLNSQIDMKTYETKIFNKFSLQIAHGKQTDDPLIQKRIGESAYYAFIYPNFMINRYGDTMDTNLVIPLSSDKTLVQFNYFFKTTAGPEYDEFLRTSVRISDEVQGEDDCIFYHSLVLLTLSYISEAVQQGLSSSAFDTGRYAPNIETAAYHFHQLLWADLSSTV